LIVSASYRSDIPAFYAEWFFQRLAAGYCLVRNPYSGRLYRVSLRPGDVSGFVFWTRNFSPLLARLEDLRAFGRPFMVQYTLTGYPRSIEAAVIPEENAIGQILELAARVSPEAAVWRYDPIVVTDRTPLDFHLENFTRLCGRLRGAVNEAVISYVQAYRKTRRNMAAAARLGSFQWIEPAPDRKRELTRRLAAIAGGHGMQLTVCSQPEYLAAGAAEARCADARRLSRLAGIPLLQVPLKGNRPDCACYESRDIGDYDTCPHGCAYCYAVEHRALARRRYRAHDPLAETLMPYPPE
jgi:hypothetical protein